MKKKYPLVLLAGRTNVGKSELFNRIVGQKRSLVLDRPGVTRDWIEEVVQWDKKEFLLTDIGGLESNSAVMSDLIHEAFEHKVKEAAVIVMVTDITVGITAQDMAVAKLLKNYAKPIILVANKADDETKDLDVYQFYKLGLGVEPIAISAIHARGIGDLLEQICINLPKNAGLEAQAEEVVCKISIIGKPNAGKSSLLNRILQQPRAIISDVPGTTREPIIERFYINGLPFQLTDTAGVRRQRSVEDELECMMVKTSMEAIRSSDLVVLMIDSSLGQLCAQDLKLLSYTIEQEKALILVLNKTDLLLGDDYALQQLESDLDKYDFLTKKFPVVRISCKENKNIAKLQKVIVEVWKRCCQGFDSDQVQELLIDELLKRPIYKSGHVLKVWRVKTFTSQTPTFHLKVNLPKFFETQHLKYIENILRKNYDLLGCPIRISYT